LEDIYKFLISAAIGYVGASIICDIFPYKNNLGWQANATPNNRSEGGEDLWTKIIKRNTDQKQLRQPPNAAWYGVIVPYTCVV